MMLNLTIVKTAVLTGLLAVAGGTTAVYAASSSSLAPTYTTTTSIQQQDDTLAPPAPEEMGEARAYFREAVQEVTAEALGISVEELEAARENRELRDLLDELGLQPADIKLAIDDAWPGIVAGAEAEGLITSDQADRLLENGFRLPRGRGQRGFQPSAEQREQAQTVLADVLGISVEELQEARANGQRLPDLIEELGLDVDEVQAQLEAARNEALQQAVEDGRLTAEQAERLQNRPLRGFGQGGGDGEFAPPAANNS